MVLSDGLAYFLKIENFFCRIHQNYLVALTMILSVCWIFFFFLGGGGGS